LPPEVEVVTSMFDAEFPPPPPPRDEAADDRCDFCDSDAEDRIFCLMFCGLLEVDPEDCCCSWGAAAEPPAWLKTGKLLSIAPVGATGGEVDMRAMA